jgi:putative DNA primase/helicase
MSAVTALAAALGLAEEGLPIFPCQPADKRPYTVHGFKDATRDPKQITAWWRRWPGALLGVPTGRASGLLAIDTDPAGAAWHHENHDRLACGRTHRTRRGHHLLYRYPDIEIRNSAGRIAPGVDVRGEGGYIIWWPAHGMEVVGGMEDLGVPPGWLLAELTNGGAAPKGGRASTSPKASATIS